MTTDTLPPLTPLDRYDVGSLLIAAVYADKHMWPAIPVVKRLLDESDPDAWETRLWVKTGVTPMAQFVHPSWADGLVLGPHEKIYPVDVAVAIVANDRAEELAELDRWDRDAHRIGIAIVVLLVLLFVGLVSLLAAQQAGAATLQPDYPTAPGHEPSISVECDGDHVIAAVHPWDRGRRNFQVWNGGALLANVNEGQWSGRFKAVSHVVYSGTRYDVRHDDCVAPTTTTKLAPTTTTAAPVPTTTSTTTPSTTTTAQPATSLPPATSTSVLSTASTITTHATTPAPTIPTPPTSDAGPTPPTVPSPVTARAGELPRTGGDASLGTIALIIGTLGLALWALSMWVDRR